MATETDQQLRIFIEDLDAVLHTVDHPDVVIAVDGDTFWSCEVPGTVASFAEHGNEFPVTIEDLDTIVETVGDIEIAIMVDRHSRRPGEITRSGKRVFLSAGADPA